jgi:hypothetical protein
MERLNATQKEMLALERFFPHHLREQAEQICFALSLLFLSFAIFCNFSLDLPIGKLWPIAEGLFLVTFAVLLKTILIELYFHSLRLRLERQTGTTFATLLVIGLHHPKKKDLARAFLSSHLGKEVAERLGIAREAVRDFVHHKIPVELPVPTSGTFGEVAEYLHDEDPYFRDFFERAYVSKDLLVKASHATETKHHRRLSSRVFLKNAFRTSEQETLTVEHATRREIEEFEYFHGIIITEQATQKIIEFFKEDLMTYASEYARGHLIAELIEWCLSSHRSRFHAASVILPADVRHFLINKKAVM